MPRFVTETAVERQFLFSNKASREAVEPEVNQSVQRQLLSKAHFHFTDGSDHYTLV